MRSETQPYSTVLQHGCVALRMRPGTKVGDAPCLINVDNMNVLVSKSLCLE